MKADLVYWHKAKLQERYILEMKIHKVSVSTKYPDGIKYGLIFIDSITGKKVLMDNHHPKGPHIHKDNEQMFYDYSNEEKLINDFRALVLEYMGVKI